MAVEQVVRLSSEVYNALEKEVRTNTIVTDKTTDIQAGYALGIQHVLGILRRGYTIGL